MRETKGLIEVDLGRKYLTPNEALIIAMQKAAISEGSDTIIKQHLLAALQKLSLR
jgi:hypothetical protein